jgi:hypothetical protein
MPSKILLVIAGLILLTGIVLFIPYRVPGVPEWKLQIQDVNGRPAAGLQIEQEWLDPDRDGVTAEITGTSNADGFVVFPEHQFRNRLVERLTPNLSKRFTASVHMYTCWNGQHGQIFWYAPAPRPSILRLEAGPVCPYS